MERRQPEPTQRRITACHEAGHGLVARVLRVTVLRIDINHADERNIGLTRTDARENQYHEKAVIARGGTQAELQTFGEILSGENHALDVSGIADNDARCTNCGTDESAVKSAHDSLARSIIKNHSVELCNLADTLFSKGVLEGNEEIDKAMRGDN